MSWIATKKAKRLKRKKKTQVINNVFAMPAGKKYVCFNMFTKDGENRMRVKAPRPMTLDEAQIYFDALCIGAEY
jgi:hypothetical protein